MKGNQPSFLPLSQTDLAAIMGCHLHFLYTASQPSTNLQGGRKGVRENNHLLISHHHRHHHHNHHYHHHHHHHIYYIIITIVIVTIHYYHCDHHQSYHHHHNHCHCIMMIIIIMTTMIMMMVVMMIMMVIITIIIIMMNVYTLHCRTEFTHLPSPLPSVTSVRWRLQCRQLPLCLHRRSLADSRQGTSQR